MTNLQSILDAIDRALADYDASALPPLPGPDAGRDATAFVDIAHVHSFDFARWQADIITKSVDPAPKQDPTRGWLLRWFKRPR